MEVPPPENADRFFAFWLDHIKDNVSRQPGLMDGILHRSTDPEGPFQFINVARWESAEQLASALQAAVDELPLVKILQDLRVTVSQNNYAEAVRYGADIPSRQETPR